MRIAIAGKGGSGKTTIAGTLARTLARGGRDVIAIDADTNPNLAVTLGITAATPDLAGLPLDLLERRTDADGAVRTVFAADPDQIVDAHAIRGPDDVRLLVMGRVGHGGLG